MDNVEIGKYHEAIPEFIKDPVLRAGQFNILPLGFPENYAGGYCVVYPCSTPTGKYAMRCWHASVEDAQVKAQILSKTLKTLSLPYFVDFEYVAEGIFAGGTIRPITRMNWVEAKDLREYVTDNLNNRSMLERLLENFVEMASTLHKHNLSHGDMQHGNILVKSDGSLLLVDYDTMYAPGMEGLPNSNAGLLGFQHPSRRKDTKLSPKADYFSELVIYVTLKAAIEKPDLWYKYKCHEDSPDLIFHSQDFDDISRSAAYREVSDISDDMAVLVAKLRESCQMAHFEQLHPLEEVIASLGVTTIVPKIDLSEWLDQIDKERATARQVKIDKMRQVQNVDYSDMLDAVDRQRNVSKHNYKKDVEDIKSSIDQFLQDAKGQK